MTKTGNKIRDTQDSDTIITSKSKETKLIERDNKRKKVSKGYYNIPEPEMQKIIAKAQAGSQKDQEYLLQIFSNFLDKYVNMLDSGYYDLRDYDIKRFVNLYIGDGILRHKIRNDSLNLKSYKQVSSTIKGILSMVKRYNDKEDVKQTVQMTFIQCVLHYEKKGEIPFSGYLYSFFFYILKRNVDLFLIDQLGLKSFPLVTDDSVGSSFESGEPGMVYESTVPTAPALEDMLGIDDIDEYWVLGETCSYPFNILTVHERQLIKWRYVDGLRPNKIAEKTSDHPNTCRQHIKVIVKKINSMLGEDHNIPSFS